MSSLRNFPVPKAIKIRALQNNLTQKEIANIISQKTGKYLSPRRLNDMIHGLRRGEWDRKYHLLVAEILNFRPSEIRDPTFDPKSPLA